MEERGTGCAVILLLTFAVPAAEIGDVWVQLLQNKRLHRTPDIIVLYDRGRRQRRFDIYSFRVDGSRCKDSVLLGDACSCVEKLSSSYMRPRGRDHVHLVLCEIIAEKDEGRKKIRCVFDWL